MQTELAQSNEWAGRLNAELTQAGAAIAGLQKEIGDERRRDMREKVRQLEGELAARLDWIHNLDGQVERLERELVERTQWAQSLQAELAQREAQLRMAASSKWVRLGRRLNVGPEIVTGSGQPE